MRAQTSVVSVREMGRLVHARAVNRPLMAMLVAYLDESSDEKKARAFAIGGFVAHDSEWERLELLWIDATHGLKAFHASDCETGHGEFSEEKGWDHAKRAGLFKKLVSLINQHNLYGFASALLVEDFRAVYPEAHTSHLYHLCFQHCILGIAKWAAAADEPVAFFFDQNREVSRQAQDVYNGYLNDLDFKERKYLESLTFASKEKFICLQAADLLAREAFKHVDNRYHYSHRKTRKPIERIGSTGRLSLEFWTKDSLQELKRLQEAEGMA